MDSGRCSFNRLSLSNMSRRRSSSVLRRSDRRRSRSRAGSSRLLNVAGRVTSRVLPVRSPPSQVSLSSAQDLACLLVLLEGWVCITGLDRGVVEELEEVAGVAGEHGLLLASFEEGGGVDEVGFLELLAGSVGQLSLGDERLGFGADEFLLELRELCAGGFLVLELGDFILDLSTIHD